MKAVASGASDDGMVALARALQCNPHTLQPMTALRRLACGGKWLAGTAASRSSGAAAFADALLVLCEAQRRAQLHPAAQPFPWPLSKLNLAKAPPAGSLHLSVDTDTQRAIVDALLHRSWRERRELNAATLAVNRIQQPHPHPLPGVLVRERLELVVARDGHKPSKLCVYVSND